MMDCKKCGGIGYIEGWHAGSASYTPSLQQCPEFCDIGAYTLEVQKRTRDGYVTQTPVLQPVSAPINNVVQLRFKERESLE